MLAGILIALSATIYLSIGGTVGAILFSIGLLTVLRFECKLFTGKAGLLITNEISVIELIKVYLGNFLGVAAWGTLLRLSEISIDANNIVIKRLEATLPQTLFLGICCGILMYIAVNLYKTFPIGTIMTVAAFVILGAHHSIADMFYFVISVGKFSVGKMFSSLIVTTIGNVIGCNLIPYLLQTRKIS